VSRAVDLPAVHGLRDAHGDAEHLSVVGDEPNTAFLCERDVCRVVGREATCGPGCDVVQVRVDDLEAGDLDSSDELQQPISCPAPLTARERAAARIDAPRAVPLLERAIGEVPATYAGRPRLLDPVARRAILLREADAGATWTSRTAAARCGVTQATAVTDLVALVRDDRLAIVGRGRSRSYVSSGTPR
jgi:hypothetical protein